MVVRGSQGERGLFQVGGHTHSCRNWAEVGASSSRIGGAYADNGKESLGNRLAGSGRALGLELRRTVGGGAGGALGMGDARRPLPRELSESALSLPVLLAATHHHNGLDDEVVGDREAGPLDRGYSETPRLAPSGMVQTVRGPLCCTRGLRGLRVRESQPDVRRADADHARQHRPP